MLAVAPAWLFALSWAVASDRQQKTMANKGYTTYDKGSKHGKGDKYGKGGKGGNKRKRNVDDEEDEEAKWNRIWGNDGYAKLDKPIPEIGQMVMITDPKHRAYRSPPVQREDFLQTGQWPPDRRKISKGECILELSKNTNHLILDVVHGVGIDHKYWVSIKIATPSIESQTANYEKEYGDLQGFCAYDGDVWINLAVGLHYRQTAGQPGRWFTFCEWPTCVSSGVLADAIPRSLPSSANR